MNGFEHYKSEARFQGFQEPTYLEYVQAPDTSLRAFYAIDNRVDDILALKDKCQNLIGKIPNEVQDALEEAAYNVEVANKQFGERFGFTATEYIAMSRSRCE